MIRSKWDSRDPSSGLRAELSNNPGSETSEHVSAFHSSQYIRTLSVCYLEVVDIGQLEELSEGALLTDEPTLW